MSNPKQAAGTTGLHAQISAALAAKFDAKLASEGERKTTVLERLIAAWCGCRAPAARRAGRPKKTVG